MDIEPKRFFFPVDPDLPVKERVRLIEEYENDLPVMEDDTEFAIHPKDVKVLRGYLHDIHAAVRAGGIVLLSQYGPLDWSDLEVGALDPDEDVRDQTLWVIESGMWLKATELRDSDRPKCVSLLAKVAEKYNDYYRTGSTMRSLSEEHEEWLELTWSAANSLLDPDNLQLNTMLVVCYFEDVITGNNWGPDDPHIRPWIEGNDWFRKAILLDVASWMGLEEGRLSEIVEALAKGRDKEIAGFARDLIKEKGGKKSDKATSSKKRKRLNRE